MGGEGLNGRFGTDARRVLLLALLVAFGLQWKSCAVPNRVHEDWRVHADWRAPSFQEFHPDDPLVEFQRFRSAPLADALYTTLSRTGIDAAWGKLNGIVWFAVTVLLVFYAARAMAPGRTAGWIAALVFALFPTQMSPFVGGLMPGLSILLLCGTLFSLAIERWRWCVPAVLVLGFVDPAAAVHTALVVAIAGWRRSPIAVALAILASLAVLGTGYVLESNEFGELATRVDMRGRPEFSHAGPAQLLPTPSIGAMLWRHLGSATYIATCLAAFLMLGTRMLALPRSLYALLIASLAHYAAADVLLMHLGLPSEIAARGLPLFGALSAGVWFERMLVRENTARHLLATRLVDLRASPAVLALAMIGLIAVYEHRAALVPTGDLDTREFGRTELYDAIRDLPGGVMLASHPRTASELPLMTGRSVVISSALLDPSRPVHWRRSEERIHDVLRAYYTTDPRVLLDVTRKYGIDYWVVDLRRYRDEARTGAGMDHEPFASWARENLNWTGDSILRRMPASYRIWDDQRALFIVSAKDVERRAVVAGAPR